MVSLITPIYSNKIHKNFFSSILEQTDKNFQIIIFTNNISIDLTNCMKEIEAFNSIKMQVIFTTKRLGFNEVIIRGIKLSTGSHAIIANSSESYLNSFVGDLNNIIEKHKDVDILEFKASIKGFERWIPLERCDLKQDYSFNILEYPKIVVYAQPFISNKIFKVSLALFASKQMSYIETKTHLTIAFLYMMLLEAKTYVYVNKIFANIIIEESDIPNYMFFYKEWKKIRQKYEIEKRLLQEIEYAQMFYIEIIIPMLYSSNKLTKVIFIYSNSNKVLQTKIYDKNKNIREQEASSFISTNKYMLLNLLETEYLSKSHPPNEWPKMLKLFKE